MCMPWPFRLRLPLTPSDDPARRRPMRARRSIAGLRVLVAEDQEMVRSQVLFED